MRDILLEFVLDDGRDSFGARCLRALRAQSPARLRLRQKLERMTVATGCTPAEAEAAKAKLVAMVPKAKTSL
jgi:hypothetical protein